MLDPALDPVLAKTSRSFALTLRLLPGATRRAVALAYLFARAADTIADTRLVPLEERRRLLAAFGSLVRAHPAPEEIAFRDDVLAEVRVRLTGPAELPEERALLQSLPLAFDIWDREPHLERALTEKLLATIVSGMDRDLERFPDERPEGLRSLETRHELLDYCWRVAGCVGEFWTELHGARLPGLAKWDAARQVERGKLFGRALQLTNVLRDVPRDLRHGRCYLPRTELAAVGLTPRDLLDPASWERARPVFQSLVAHAFDCCRAGLAYTVAIPRTEPMLRLATALPLLLALPTLGLLLRGNALDGRTKRKISRAMVFRTLGATVFALPSNVTLRRLFRVEARRSGFEL